MLFPKRSDNDETRNKSDKSSTNSGDSELTWKLKSAPVESLTHFMGTVLCNVNDMHGKGECGISVDYMKRLMQLCICRYAGVCSTVARNCKEISCPVGYGQANQWVSSFGGGLLTNSCLMCWLIPYYSIPGGSPDMRCCLLHQKLQMLNCCIQHKLSHQQKLKTSNISKNHSSVTNLSHLTPSSSSSGIEFHTPLSSVRQSAQHLEDENIGSSSEDEFYEALEDVPLQTKSGYDTSEMEISESDDQVAGMEEECITKDEISFSGKEGVLKQCGDLVLIANGRPLCIPITQVGMQYHNILHNFDAYMSITQYLRFCYSCTHRWGTPGYEVQ